MRRTKKEITPLIKEMVIETVNFYPKEIESIKNDIIFLEENILSLQNMKHRDYINHRKKLMSIIKKTKILRDNILQTHKIFTK